MPDYPFGNHGFLKVSSSGNVVNVDMNLDLKYLTTGWGSSFVGGFLVQAMRDMTVGDGYSVIVGNEVSSVPVSAIRSVSDLLVIDICGEDKIRNYLEGLRGYDSMFANQSIVPHIDTESSSIPTCLTSTHSR